MIGAQYWVVMVVCRYPGPGGDAEDEMVRARIDQRLETGELLCLPDASVAEAISVHGDESSAHAERERLSARNRLYGARAGDYRVIMTSALGGIA